MRALVAARSVPRTLATRGATLWLLTRVLISFVFAVPRIAGADAAHPNPGAVVAICVLVGLVDLRRRGEEMLWSNLGVSRTQLVALFAATAAIGEIVLALALR